MTVLNFCKKEPILTVSALAALVSCALVPPDRAYLGYIDFRTLALLYALMGIGAARVDLSGRSEARADALQVYLLQLAINFTWSIFFFRLGSYGGALAVLLLLLGLIVWMILRFRRVDRPAARLQLPYLLWVVFAAYLNAGVFILNR